MRDKIYLLDISEWVSDLREEVFAEALQKLDPERRQKAEKIKRISPRAASIGAGLLLQKAAGDFCKNTGGKDAEVIVLRAEELLGELTEPRCLIYHYGEGGKPYLEGNPFYFSLSHSGAYVLCAVSGQEIGADIQEMHRGNEMRTAERFFAQEELAMLKSCVEEERAALFYKLWVRKEAFGKLTGQGIGNTVSESMLDGKNLIWLDFAVPKGYKAVACRRADNVGCITGSWEKGKEKTAGVMVWED